MFLSVLLSLQQLVSQFIALQFLWGGWPDSKNNRYKKKNTWLNYDTSICGWGVFVKGCCDYMSVHVVQCFLIAGLSCADAALCGGVPATKQWSKTNTGSLWRLVILPHLGDETRHSKITISDKWETIYTSQMFLLVICYASKPYIEPTYYMLVQHKALMQFLNHLPMLVMLVQTSYPA